MLPQNSGKLALVIRIEGARLFRPGRFDLKKRRRLADVPLGRADVRVLANMLRVLAAQRPIPTMYPTLSSRNLDATADVFYELAEASMVRLAVMSGEYKTYKGEIAYNTEVKTTRKAVGDSWQTTKCPWLLDGNTVGVGGGDYSYIRTRDYLGQELYDKFIDLLREVKGTNEPQREFLHCQTALEFLNARNDDPRVIAFATACDKHHSRRSSITNIIMYKHSVDTKDRTTLATTYHYYRRRYPNNTMMVANGIENVYVLSGNVYVPIDRHDILSHFESGPGVATYLEGGAAVIEGITPWSRHLIYGCHPPVVGNIVVPDIAKKEVAP